tara:strand:- start:1065 stop:1247 length:183 start_codon:yes stop_codon:yes gene_type:complete
LPPEGLLDALARRSLIKELGIGEFKKSLIDLLEEIASETFIVKLLAGVSKKYLLLLCIKI